MDRTLDIGDIFTSKTVGELYVNTMSMKLFHQSPPPTGFDFRISTEMEFLCERAHIERSGSASVLKVECRPLTQAFGRMCAKGPVCSFYQNSHGFNGEISPESVTLIRTAKLVVDLEEE